MKEKEIERIYNLANLSLENKDVKLIAEKYNKVNDFIENIFQVDTQGVEMTEIVASHPAILREDSPKESLSRDEALKNAKDTEFGYFRLDWKL
jgi:aspartyl-tRNA(Asn)/glutamyl-tRNA(Gln) amidotransferase subunit C